MSLTEIPLAYLRRLQWFKTPEALKTLRDEVEVRLAAIEAGGGSSDLIARFLTDRTTTVGAKLALLEGTNNGTSKVIFAAPNALGADRTITIPDANVDLGAIATALANAATAQSTANTGVTNAATAQTTANTAVTNAAAAQTDATLALGLPIGLVAFGAGGSVSVAAVRYLYPWNDANAGNANPMVMVIPFDCIARDLFIRTTGAGVGTGTLDFELCTVDNAASVTATALKVSYDVDSATLTQSDITNAVALTKGTSVTIRSTPAGTVSGAPTRPNATFALYRP